MANFEIKNYDIEAFYYTFSKMLERASYYGFRSLLVFYLVEESLNLKNGEALTIYAWFTGSIIVSQIFGAVLGDLIIGNKKSIIVGGIIQAVGLFVLCASSITFFYLGLILVVLGSGFYTPNIFSNFG